MAAARSPPDVLAAARSPPDVVAAARSPPDTVAAARSLRDVLAAARPPPDPDLLLELKELADSVYGHLSTIQMEDMLTLMRQGISLNLRHEFSAITYRRVEEFVSDLYALCAIYCKPSDLVARAEYIRQAAYLNLPVPRPMLLENINELFKFLNTNSLNLQQKTGLVEFILDSLRHISDSTANSGPAFMVVHMCRGIAELVRTTDPSLVTEDLLCDLFYKEAHYLKQEGSLDPLQCYQTAKEAYDRGGSERTEVVVLLAECAQLAGKSREVLRYAREALRLSPQNDRAKELEELAAPQHSNASPLSDNPIVVDADIENHQLFLNKRQKKAQEQDQLRAAKKQQKARQRERPLVDNAGDADYIDDASAATAPCKEIANMHLETPDDRGRTGFSKLQSEATHGNRKRRSGVRRDTDSSGGTASPRSGTPQPDKHRAHFPTDTDHKSKTPKFREETLSKLMELLKDYEVAPGCSKRELAIKPGYWGCGCRNKECSRDRIILEFKSANGKKNRIEIRQRPPKYRVSDELCKGFTGLKCVNIFKGRGCWAPHSDLERTFWKNDIQNQQETKTFRLKDLLQDVQRTNVVLHAYISRAMEKCRGNFKAICSVCMEHQIITFKKKHVHVCDKEEDEHEWSDPSCGLVFKDGDEIIQLQDDRQEKYDILYHTMNVLKIMGHTNKNISDESQKIIQKIKASQNKEIVQTTSENAFGNTCQGIELLDEAALEKLKSIGIEETVERLKGRHRYLDESGGCSDKYYEDYSKDKIKLILKNDKNNKYKLCRIHLDTTMKAVCNPVDHGDKDARIDIHSRMNCGNAMDGDIVLVEKLDSIVADNAVPRGKVLGVYERMTDREMYTFVCEIDHYSTWLMKPLCRRAPKIHVVKDVLVDRYGRQGINGYVAFHNDDLTVKRIIKVTPTTENNFLFVVRYLKWTPDRIYPLGFVDDIIPAGHTVRLTQLVLDLMHQVSPSTDEEINFPQTVQCPGREDLTMVDGALSLENVDGRKYFTRLLTVSIDPLDCKDVDDALSLEKLNGDIEGQHVCNVYVHIADVSEYLEKGGPLDDNTEARGFTYYPTYGLKNYNMLPVSLSENLCSLVRSKYRYALTVKVKMLENGKILETSIHKSVIKNDIQLTYEEAQQKIRAEDKDGLSKMLTALFQLSCALKKTRVGAPDGVFYTDNDMDVMKTNDPHILVEEMMILANNKVAELLYMEYPGIVPLRKQDKPNMADMNNFVKTYWHMIHYSKYFNIFKHWLSECRNKNEIEEIPSELRLLVSTVNSLKTCMHNGDENALQLLLTQERLHPMHAITILQWFMYQWRSEYTCNKNGHAHFSLQLAQYTHFTSPIRRYVDIMVHRMLKAILDSQPCPYSSDEMRIKLNAINIKENGVKTYDKANKILEIIDIKLKDLAFVPALITDVSEKGFSISIADFESKIRSCSEILFSCLQVAKKPAFSECGNEVTMMWSKRIYDAAPYVPHSRRFANTESIKLNPNMYVAQLSHTTWNTVLESIGGNKGTFLQATSDLINEAELSTSTAQGAEEVTSEMKSDCDFYRHRVNFTLDVGKESVVMLQIGAQCTRGQLQPLMTLMRLTPQNDICLHHNALPIQCFAELASKKVQLAYRDIDEYKEIWLPILSMESVTKAVSDNEPIIIHNVPVRLKAKSGGMYGHFKLVQSFCKKRNLGFMKTSGKVEGEMEDVQKLQILLCIRYKYKVHGEWKAWCGHAVAFESVVKFGSRMVIVHFRIHYKLIPPPTELLQKETNCTIESLPISLPNSRMEFAMLELQTASTLTQDIALRRSIDALFTDVDGKVPLPENIDIKGTVRHLPTNNDSQNTAIRAALRQNFTLIQGPPGTGKTLTAVKLVYWLVEMNRRRQEKEGTGHRQVLICGPSHSAVDVAMNLLIDRLGNLCPRVVRVYSELLEQQVFPIPRDQLSEGSSKGRTYRLVDSLEHRKIALHHLIRKRSNSCSSQIKQYDNKFQKCLNSPQNVSDDEIEQYKRLVTEAAIEELPKYDVVLSTCAASVSPRMQRGCTVEQVIIDECGMCMEPEALIPLVQYSPRQVVLVGDHQQLRPIIIDRNAAELGAATSLFERYKDHAMMLDTQYRMHPKICEFPSKEFYENKLKTNYSKSWMSSSLHIWPNQQCPFVFLHVEGREVAYTVSTDEGHQGSYYNETERDHVTRIFLGLRTCYDVPERFISVLSQYKAQVTEVKKSLGYAGVQNANIMSVVSSQGGEWDYVILSLVRSLPEDELDTRPSPGWLRKNMGFITDHNQINVAITRAKKGLIILGNAKLLRKDDMWRRLLEHYSSRGALRSASDFLV